MTQSAITIPARKVLQNVSIRVKVEPLFGKWNWRKRIGMAVMRAGIWLGAHIMRLSIKLDASDEKQGG